MKKQITKNIFRILCLTLLIFEMAFLCWEALTPGKESAAQSGAVGDVIDEVHTHNKRNEEAPEVAPESIGILRGGNIAEDFTLALGTSATLTTKILPENTSVHYRKVIWRSSDEAILTVNSGTVAGVGVGTATVAALIESNQSILATVTVTVKEIYAESITLAFSGSKKEVSIEAGKTAALVVSTVPAGVATKSITYLCNAPEVATVTKNGIVQAVAPGEATITATYFGKNTDGEEYTLTDSVSVKVTPKTIVEPVPPTALAPITSTDIKQDGGTSYLFVGSEGKFTATISPANCTDKLLVWASSDNEILSINRTSGAFNTHKKGKVTVSVYSAAAPALMQELTLDVHNETLGAVISADGLTGENGNYTLKVTVGTHISLLTETTAETFVRYETSDHKYAEISNDGTVLPYRATGRGTVTLTVLIADNADFNTENGNLCETFTIVLTVAKVPFSSTVKNWSLVIRKLFGHFGAFLVLGLLAASNAILFDKKSWKKRILMIFGLVVFGFTFACVTELFQSEMFTVGRTASFADVIIDCNGFLYGALILYGIFLIVALIVQIVNFFKNRKKQ